MILTNEVIAKAMELNPELDPKILAKVYDETFRVTSKLLSEGNRPGVVFTNLITFDLSKGRLKYKALKLVKLILTKDLDKLKKNFYICSIAEAEEMLTETIRIYKMRKRYDIENKLSKQRKS